ncbi:MAG TPA: hypothetical protein PK054_05425 [Anaerohalosphaeraceae bacterium]|nr:hypothetical protein [Anaerohalosphaeraceae bacterium]HOL88145.1 hypothetical protein [Anaerohalosphaeraceae bacterium]HPP56006.1 hypothetical protein [Anaerohalosphaeraceae bacterium]
MKHVKHSALIILFCWMSGYSLVCADEVIYSNTAYSGFVFSPDPIVFDYGISAGGFVKTLRIGYFNNESSSNWIRLDFYDDFSKTSFEMWGHLKTILIQNLPTTGGQMAVYDYVLPEQDRFTLPAGSFGFTLDTSFGMNAALASGGAGNENRMWKYDPFMEVWNPFWFGGNPWAGIYLQITSGPPIEEITCDIKGYKFNDLNADGVWEPGEPAVPGWEIFLDLNDNGQKDAGEPSAVTNDPNGMYVFENLPAPAIYTIREAPQAGWTQTFPGPAHQEKFGLIAEPNHIYSGFDFGNTQQVVGEISGSVFHDSNGNSVRDGQEAGLAGWRVFVDLDANDRWDTGEPYAFTLADGTYQISGLGLGTYRIAEEMNEGWVQTVPTASCTYSVVLTASAPRAENIHFGNHTFYGYGGGAGTPSSPYLISNHLHLQAVGAHPWDWDKHFKLTADIDLSKYNGAQFNLIGRYAVGETPLPFTGVLDGNGFAIANFTYHYDGWPQIYIGLFGYIRGGQVRNLRLENINVSSSSGLDSGALAGLLGSGSVLSNCHCISGRVEAMDWAAGALAGAVDEASIFDCSAAAAEVVSAQGEAGGLAGRSNEGTLRNCSFQGTVSGWIAVGGLVGSNLGQIFRCRAEASVNGVLCVGGLVGEHALNGWIEQSFAEGEVNTYPDPQLGLEGGEAGGLVGRSMDGDILNSCSTAAVNAQENAGGLAGVCWGSQPGSCTITNCYSAGLVTGGSGLGGLIGQNVDGMTDIVGCFWDVQTSGQSVSEGGTGLTTAQMQDPAFYLAAGWDFVHIWRLCSLGEEYPTFRYLYPKADFVCPDGIGAEDLQALADEWLAEKCRADIAPAGGDGFVDFLDWARMASAWLTDSSSPKWDALCDLAPSEGDEIVDLLDVAVFSEQWLFRSALWGDIAPEPEGDGRVDLEDFCLFARLWMLEEQQGE